MDVLLRLFDGLLGVALHGGPRPQGPAPPLAIAIKPLEQDLPNSLAMCTKVYDSTSILFKRS